MDSRMKMILKPLILLFLTMFIMSNEASPATNEKADLIICNAKIYSPDSLAGTKNCIAIRNGKIIAIGNSADIFSNFQADKTIDASGMFLYPGFIDAHSHFTGLAKTLRYADLTIATTFDQVLEILKEFRKNHPDGWLVGFGWDQNNWPEKKFPDNTQLNMLFPGVPVVLTRIDGHAVLASETAIRSAGILKVENQGEAFLKDGKFTGIFLEGMADNIKEAIPMPSADEMENYMITAAKLCHESGLTSVTDAGLTRSEIMFLEALQKSGKITLRVDAWLSPTQENFDFFLKNPVYKTPFLRVGTIKMYADGALGSRGACLLFPYSDDLLNKGLLVTSPERLSEVCKLAYDNGFQMSTHAIGDSAVRMVLKTYGSFLQTGNDRRWRIEHVQVVDEQDFGLIAKYCVVPSIQATHATSDMDWAPQRLGPERIKNAYAYNRLLRLNGWLPNGTDFPIEGIEPLKTFYASVARKNMQGLPTNGFMMDNALSRMDALKSITTWAAKASFAEKERGSIEVGMDADITILDTDIVTIPENRILNAKVQYTIINGEIVYKSR